MAITLSGVLGTTTQQQPIALAQGEGATINVPTTSGGAAEDFSSYAVKTCRFCARRRDGTVIVDRLGSFVSGVPQFVINSSDTKDIAPQIAAYDVWVTLDGVPSRIVARSVFQLLETEVDLDAVATTPTSEMMLVGLPAVSAPNVGQVLTVADDSPLTLAWADGGAGGGLPAGFFNVASYGAVGDGTTDDGPAFQAAFDAAEAAKGGLIIAPATSNSYKIATPVVVSCGTSEAVVYTMLAVGKILIATGPDADAFEMSNNGSLIFDRCTFIGNLETTAPALIDCRHMIVAAGQTNLLFRDCRILGVMASTTLAATALIQVSGTVRYERTVFGGCSASYCHETTALHGFECDDLRFYDYWYADGVTHSKTPYGVSHWVHIETGASAQPIEGAISQGTVQIRNISFDEGAQNALVIYGGSPSTKVDRVVIDGVTALQSNQSSSHVLYLDGIRRCTVRNVAVKTPSDHDYIQALNIDSLVIEETTRNPAFPASIELGANIGCAILRNVEADSIHGVGAALAILENNGVKQLLPPATPRSHLRLVH